MFDTRHDGPADGDDAVRPPDVTALLACEPGGMNGAELVDAIAESERALSAVTAWQMRALSALTRPGVAGDPMSLAGRLAGRYTTGGPDADVAGAFVQDAAESLAAGEVAAVLRISPVTAGVRVRDAIRMCTELPATLQALAAGTIDRGKARVIAEHTAPLPERLVDTVQAWVLPIAQAQSTAATRKAVAAAVIAVDPRGAQARHDAARRERDLTVQPSTDGMSMLKAYLAADGAVSIFQLADLLATHTVGFIDDTRSIGARRVDALTDLAGQILTHGHVDLVDYLTPDLVADADALDADAIVDPVASEPAGPEAVISRQVDGRVTRRLSRQGRRLHLQVTIGLGTLAGLDDLPADLAGYGAVTAGMARTIAASAATLCTLLADEGSGAVLAAGAHRYRPRQDLRDHLTALADSCRFPSCRQPVWRCDIDHRERFDHHRPRSGGTTVPGNTDPLCRRHHLFKHHTGWTLRRDSPTPADPAGLGATWTSPTGHTYRDPARQVAVPAGWTVRRTDDPNGADGPPDGPSGSDVTDDATDLTDATDPADPADLMVDAAHTIDPIGSGQSPAAGTTNAGRNRPSVPDLLEHRHMQARTDQGTRGTTAEDTEGCAVAEGAGDGGDPGVSAVEDDRASLLLREHLLGRLGNRGATAEHRSATEARDEHADPPPF